MRGDSGQVPSSLLSKQTVSEITYGGGGLKKHFYRKVILLPPTKLEAVRLAVNIWFLALVDVSLFSFFVGKMNIICLHQD